MFGKLVNKQPQSQKDPLLNSKDVKSVPSEKTDTKSTHTSTTVIFNGKYIDKYV